MASCEREEAGGGGENVLGDGSEATDALVN